MVESALVAPARLPFLDRSENWLELVNSPQTEAELEQLRHSIRGGTPFGAAGWINPTAIALGLESTLRPQGRPRKQDQDKGAAETPLLF